MATKDDVDTIMEQLKALMSSVDSSNTQIGDRLTALEEKADVKPALSQLQTASSAATTESHVHVNAAKEKLLSLTFGETECSPNMLRLFIEHFNIAREQNVAKGVHGWSEKTFRANELRFQLRGDPALWLAQECAMLKDWTKDDVQIVVKLITC